MDWFWYICNFYLIDMNVSILCSLPPWRRPNDLPKHVGIYKLITACLCASFGTNYIYMYIFIYSINPKTMGHVCLTWLVVVAVAIHDKNLVVSVDLLNFRLETWRSGKCDCSPISRIRTYNSKAHVQLQMSPPLGNCVDSKIKQLSEEKACCSFYA